LRPALRVEGYAPIRDYAAIGDGRTVALVARDGSIDWLCLPNADSPSVFAAILDADQGGRFQLAPEAPYAAERRYVPDTNVLETTFRTDAGVIRVTDAMTLPTGGLAPMRELARKVEGLSGNVPVSWTFEPRFQYAQRRPRLARRGEAVAAEGGRDAVAVCSWGAGDPEIEASRVAGHFVSREGTRALLALPVAHEEPLVFPSRDEVNERLDATIAFWRRWTGERAYDGPWRDAVLRSALALKLLVFAPSGAIAAAPTTSLPETIGGKRNWDYRFSWVRDSAFTIEALLDLGCPGEAKAFFSWISHASRLTHPRLQVLYQLNGGNRAPEKTLPLAGYRGSKPVRVGNGAVSQRQLDVYGDLLQTAWIFSRRGLEIDAGTGKRLAQIADHVCDVWREPDQGVWEVRDEPRQFTQSKMLCFTALARAAALADTGAIPGGGRDRWRREAAAVREFVETRCFSVDKDAYVRFAGSEELDASVLLASIMGYAADTDPRLMTTVDAVRTELARGALVYRYLGEDGVGGEEGAFLPCSFWLVETLARAGRFDEAAELMEELIAIANDVGLYSEEVDPDTGEFLGNFPQGLVHLALVSAAACYAERAS
jgi:GH15 family glucan-1,4-alpha-glucosidase